MIYGSQRVGLQEIDKFCLISLHWNNTWIFIWIGATFSRVRIKCRFLKRVQHSVLLLDLWSWRPKSWISKISYLIYAKVKGIRFLASPNEFIVREVVLTPETVWEIWIISNVATFFVSGPKGTFFAPKSDSKYFGLIVWIIWNLKIW